MAFDVQRVIAAFQAGQQIKQQREQRERDAEDRKFQIEVQKHQLQALKLADQKAERDEAIQTAGLMQGQPAKEVGGFTLPSAPGGMREDNAAPTQEAASPTTAMASWLRQSRQAAPTFTAPIPGMTQAPTEIPLDPVTIPGVTGPDTTIQPQSSQDLIRQARGQKVFESQLKQEENAVQLPAELLGGKPGESISVDKTIADNLINNAASNARQGQQQEFTSDENRKRLEAESIRAKEDRDSRERVAAANRVASASRAIQTGKTNKAAQQSLTMANQFDSNPIVKNYAVIQEGANFAKMLKPTSTDDIGLIYAFAKAMDPGSVVREGEYATVQKYAQSWAQQFGFKMERIFSNQPFLSQEARSNMVATIAKKEAAAKISYENLRKEVGKKFANIQEKPEDWLVNYNLGRSEGQWEIVP